MKKILEFSGFLEKKDRELRERQQEALKSFYKAAADDAQCHTMASGVAMLAAGGRYIETLAEDKKFVKWMDDSCANWDRKFMEKYGQKIQAAPDMPVPRIQYFGRMLWELIPQLEDINRDEKWCQAVSEFGELYIEYMEETLNMWCNLEPKIMEMLDNMDSVLHMSHSMPENSIIDAKNAIAYILAVCTDSKDVKARILLGTTMLFHAYSGLTDLKLETLKQGQDME